MRRQATQPLVAMFACLMLMVSASALEAQTATVAGVVTDATTGQPLGGVSVSIEGAGAGTVSAADGRFMIRRAPTGEHVVVATRIGYQTLRQTVRLNANETRNLEIRISSQAVEHAGITVTANRRYVSDGTETALMFDAALQDIPQSVHIVTNDFLEDQNAGRLDDVFRNVSGINSFSSYQDYTVRGFRTQEVSYNGMRANQNNFFATPKMNNVERVEVLKGPAAILIGEFEPGGFVNVVTKRPRAVRHMRFAATGGSWDERRTGLDVGGPIDADGKYLFRLSADYENSGNFRRFQSQRNAQVAPAFSWVPGENTMLTLKGEYTYDHRDGGRDRGIAAPQGDVWALPIDWTVNEPGDIARNEGFSIDSHLRQALNESWTSHFQTRFTRGEYINKYHEPQPFFVDEDGTLMMRRQYRDQTFKTDAYVATIRLVGDVETGPVGHKLVVGGEYSRDVKDNERNYASVVPSINVFNPVYGVADPGEYHFNNVGTFGGDQSQVSFYIQDLMRVHPRVHVLGGARYTSLLQYSFNGNNVTASEFGSHGALSPRLGLVYEFMDDATLYGSWSMGFQPQPLARQSEDQGGPFDPQTSQQLEVGSKLGFFQNRLMVTASGYQIMKQNILQRDFEAEGVVWILHGEVRSRGAEFDVIGAPLPNWSISSNYSFNEIEITKDTREDRIGQRFPNSPKHAASLWTRFDIPGTGLGIGGGVNHVGDRETLTDLLILPSYTVADAALYYRWRAVDLALNVRNITNERFFSGGYNDFTLWPGAPRRVSLRVATDF